jgi:hypothetical protein
MTPKRKLFYHFLENRGLSQASKILYGEFTITKNAATDHISALFLRRDPKEIRIAIFIELCSREKIRYKSS